MTWQPDISSGQCPGGQAWPRTQAGEVSDEPMTYLVTVISLVSFVSQGDRTVRNASLLPDPLQSSHSETDDTDTSKGKSWPLWLSHSPSSGLVLLRPLPCMTLPSLLECLVTSPSRKYHPQNRPCHPQWPLATLHLTSCLVALVNPGTGNRPQRMEAGPASPGPPFAGSSPTTTSQQGLRNTVFPAQEES